MVMSKAASASSSPITHIEVNYKGNQLECSRNTGAGFRLRFLKSFLSCRFTWNSLKYSYGAAPTPAGYKGVALSIQRDYQSWIAQHGRLSLLKSATIHLGLPTSIKSHAKKRCAGGKTGMKPSQEDELRKIASLQNHQNRVVQ